MWQKLRDAVVGDVVRLDNWASPEPVGCLYRVVEIVEQPASPPLLYCRPICLVQHNYWLSAYRPDCVCLRQNEVVDILDPWLYNSRP